MNLKEWRAKHMTGPRIPQPAYAPAPEPGAVAQLHMPDHVKELVHDLAHAAATALVPILLAWLAKLLLPKS